MSLLRVKSSGAMLWYENPLDASRSNVWYLVRENELLHKLSLANSPKDWKSRYFRVLTSDGKLCWVLEEAVEQLQDES